MTPELSRIVPADHPPETYVVTATAAECMALAERMRIPGVVSATCSFTLRARGSVVIAEGNLVARVVQSCVVSLEPVAQEVRERFKLRFVPEGQDSGGDEPDSPDEIPYAGLKIDLGEAVAEQLGLALDPYPRHPDAVLDDVGAVEDAGSAFGTLAGLRGRVEPQ